MSSPKFNLLDFTIFFSLAQHNFHSLSVSSYVIERNQKDMFMYFDEVFTTKCEDNQCVFVVWFCKKKKRKKERKA